MVLLRPLTAAFCITLMITLLGATDTIADPVPGDDPLEELAGLHNNLGVTKALNGSYDQASVYLDSAFLLIGEHPAVLNNLGNNLLCQGRISDALRNYQMSFALDCDIVDKIVAIFASSTLLKFIKVTLFSTTLGK